MKWFQGNLGTKFFSAFFSLSLWFYVVTSERVEVNKKFKLDIVPDNKLSISNHYQKNISVKLEGARVFIESFKTEKRRIFKKLRSKKKKQIVELGAGDFGLPFGVKLVELSPRSINVRLEKKQSRLITVRPTFVGKVQENLIIENWQIVPREILVHGPKTAIGRIKNLFTRPIDLSQMVNDENTFSTSLDEIDDRLYLEGSRDISVKVRLRPKKANFTLRKVPIRFVTTGQRFRSKNKYVALDVLIPEGDKKKVKVDDVKVVAELPLRKKGRVRVKLNATLPEGVHLLHIHPSEITVSVR